MSPSDPSKGLAALLKKLKSKHGEIAPEAPPAAIDEGLDPLVLQLVFAFLLWDATAPQARTLLKRLRENFVDFNELRVALPDEIAAVVGDRYPRCHERSLRLRATLQDIFKREHGLTLTRLADMGKREARAYLDSLEGMPAYVSARVFLLGLGGHAVPVDQRLADLLAAEDVLSEEVTDAETAATWLERQIKAGEGVQAHLLFQAWSDEEGSTPRRDRRVFGPDFSPGVVAITDNTAERGNEADKKPEQPEPSASPAKDAKDKPDPKSKPAAGKAPTTKPPAAKAKPKAKAPGAAKPKAAKKSTPKG